MLDPLAVAAPLRSVPFRWYTAGQLPSVTCSWAQVVALAWVVVQLDPQALGWVIALQFLPSLVLGPWFGVVTDRNDQRQLVLAAEIGLAVVAAALAVSAVAGVLGLPLVGLLATAWGVVNALDTPARRALIPMLVPAAAAPAAAAVSGMVLLLGMSVGSAIGGLLVATAGVAVVFAMNAASFLADVVVLARLPIGALPRVRPAPQQIREGIRYVGRRPPLRTALVTLAVIAALGFTIPVSVPVLAHVGLGGEAGLVGGLFAAVTTGSLLGTLLIAAQRQPGPRLLQPCAVGTGLALAVTALSPTPTIAAIGLGGLGVAWSCLIGTVLAILQTVPAELLGRVMSLFAVVLLGGNTLGGPLATVAIAVAGPRAPFVLGAAAAAAVVAALSMTRPPALTARRGSPGRRGLDA